MSQTKQDYVKLRLIQNGGNRILANLINCEMSQNSPLINPEHFNICTYVVYAAISYFISGTHNGVMSLTQADANDLVDLWHDIWQTLLKTGYEAYKRYNRAPQAEGKDFNTVFEEIESKSDPIALSRKFREYGYTLRIDRGKVESPALMEQIRSINTLCIHDRDFMVANLSGLTILFCRLNANTYFICDSHRSGRVSPAGLCVVDAEYATNLINAQINPGMMLFPMYWIISKL